MYLLQLVDERNNNTHYCYIYNLSSFMFNNGNKLYVCDNCLCCFYKNERL